MKISAKHKEYQEVQDEISNTEMYVDRTVNNVIYLLEEFQYIKRNDENEIKGENTFSLTLSGKIGTQIREVHCILFTNLLMENKLDLLDANDLAAFLSCFTNCTVPEKLSTNVPVAKNKNVETLLFEFMENTRKLETKELQKHIESGTASVVHYNLIMYMYEWCECDDINKCKLLLQKMSIEKEIFLGEFIKAILKLNNIVNELVKIAELMGNIKLLHTLKEIPEKTLKYIATNQSLYI